MIKIALTIDDLPKHGRVIPPYHHSLINTMIIDAKKKFSLPPICGFINAHWLENDKEGSSILTEWLEEGCFLGNHTYSHYNLNNISSSEYIDDIIKNEIIINQLQIDKKKYFRYPFLAEGETEEKVNSIKQFLDTNHYTIAPVTFDFLDFLWNEPVNQSLSTDQQELLLLKSLYIEEAIIHLHAAKDAAKKIFDREINHILLLHAGIATALFLPDLITALLRQGCEFIELDQALSDEVFHTDPQFPTSEAPNFLVRWAMLTKTQIIWPFVNVEKIHHIVEKLPKINVQSDNRNYEYTK